MLDQIKALLRIDPGDFSRDNILIFLISKVKRDIREYCKRESIQDIPGIEEFMISWVFSRYRAEGYGSGNPAREVASISDNGQSVGFRPTGSAADKPTVFGFTENEKAFLNEHRRTRKPNGNTR